MAFFDVSKWRLPTYWILIFFEFLTIGTVTRLELRYHATFRVDPSNRMRYDHFSIFQDGGRRHLGYLDSRNFSRRNAQEVLTASSSQISWRSVQPFLRYGDFLISSRWRPSAILNLWCACLAYPRRAFVGSYRCVKFGCNRYSCLIIRTYASFTIWPLRLENAYLRPKNWWFWGFGPLNREQSHRDQ